MGKIEDGDGLRARRASIMYSVYSKISSSFSHNIMLQIFIRHSCLSMSYASAKAYLPYKRCMSTAKSLASDAYKALDTRGHTGDGCLLGTPQLTRVQRECLDRTIRVDQAGEIAANYIYMGQIAVLGKNPDLRPVLQVSTIQLFLRLNLIPRLKDMWDQEKKHLMVMNKLQHQHHVRPTVLSEAAKVAGYALGFSTALLGKEAAMACTEAVETVIGEHYDEYVTTV